MFDMLLLSSKNLNGHLLFVSYQVVNTNFIVLKEALGFF